MIFANFTEETCTGTGNTLELAGATSGSIPFSESFNDGDSVAYVVEDSAGIIKIAGVGIYVSATDDITRADTWNWNGTVIDNNPATNITLSGGTHTIRCDATKSTINGTNRNLLEAGRYRFPDNAMYGQPTGSPGGEFVTAAGRLLLTTARFSDSTLITEIAVDITTAAAGGNIRMGIYHANPNGTPGLLIADSGNIATDSTGFTSNTLSTPVFLSTGTYLVADMADNTTVRARGMATNVASDNMFCSIQGVISGLDQEARRFYNIGYGALPSTLGASAGSTANAGLGFYYR